MSGMVRHPRHEMRASGTTSKFIFFHSSLCCSDEPPNVRMALTPIRWRRVAWWDDFVCGGCLLNAELTSTEGQFADALLPIRSDRDLLAPEAISPSREQTERAD